MDQNTTVIVLSDDEDEGESTIYESSVLIVEENEGSREVADAPKTSEVLDEDVTITFSRKAHVLPHARYDCTIPFCFTEGDVTGPEDSNAAYCEQCFCYVCDKLASTCQFWVIPGFCHCNAHKRSFYWKSLRDKRIMGYLHELNFTFDPMDMDADLRRAEASLQQFACSLALKFAAFLVGVEKPKQPICCYCQCHSTNSRTTESHSASGSEVGCKSCRSRHVYFPEYDYSGVQERVCMFLDDAKQENPKSSIVMLLGAMKLIISHSAPGNTHSIKEVSRAVDMLLYRAKSMVQTLLVDTVFPASFTKQLQQFFHGLPFPPSCMSLKNSLNVLPWNDPLLSAVLKGQNVSGERRVKGRRAEVLLEPIVVIRARVQKLQQQKKYRELARYLKVVKSCSVQELQDLSDWAPFYLCKVGDYAGAVNAMFSSMSGSLCPASRLSPAQFCAYLRIFVSGHAPSDMPNPLFLNIQPDPFLSSTWTPVQGGSLLKRLAVVKFALRVLNCNDAVFAQSISWVAFLNIASKASIGPDGAVNCTSLREPDSNFLMRTRDIAQGILNELSKESRIQIPRTFQNLNPWALYWLFYSLVGQPNVVLDFLCVVLEELLENPHHSILRKQDTAGHCFVANFLHLFFLEHTVVFDPSTYPTNELVARWNEAQHPWQYHLRQMLEIKEQLLTSDKHRVLEMIRWHLYK
ncbi:uncharacterized protein zgc:112980 isoform X2 [Electrophorus electricus]|uniref:uncharacterized protein zgc:112980 isoform X2 n=1 Tax=Electrophorus electricus TaxID=8005 RepID=UPI0015CFB7FF|nr:uncharacterized protein zgc:112980 isoform X2 [Electrophorus electricus]